MISHIKTTAYKNCFCLPASGTCQSADRSVGLSKDVSIRPHRRLQSDVPGGPILSHDSVTIPFLNTTLCSRWSCVWERLATRDTLVGHIADHRFANSILTRAIAQLDVAVCARRDQRCRRCSYYGWKLATPGPQLLFRRWSTTLNMHMIPSPSGDVLLHNAEISYVLVSCHERRWLLTK